MSTTMTTMTTVTTATTDVPAPTRRQREQGLTIIEIAIALGVLAILFTGIFSALATSNLAATTAREAQAASEEALFRMDQLASQPYTAIAGAPPAYYHVRYKVGGFNTTAETFTDTNSNGRWDTGEVFVDTNNNRLYDAANSPKQAVLRAGPAADFNYLVARGVAGTSTSPAGDSATDPKACYVHVVQIAVNLVEIRVLVCWQSIDGTVRRIDLVSRVTA